METTLHRQLKTQLAGSETALLEFRENGFRADAISASGDWIEVQAGPLGLLRHKLTRLLPRRRVRVVKPIVLDHLIIRRASPQGAHLPARRSPRKGSLLEVFDELVNLMSLFPHPNLRIDILGVSIEEVRIPRQKRPGYYVQDRLLREIRETTTLESAHDLWKLLPEASEQLEDPFTTRELDTWLGRGPESAQRVAYCLRLSGAVQTCGFRARRRLYRRNTTDTKHSLP